MKNCVDLLDTNSREKGPRELLEFSGKTVKLKSKFFNCNNESNCIAHVFLLDFCVKSLEKLSTFPIKN